MLNSGLVEEARLGFPNAVVTSSEALLEYACLSLSNSTQTLSNPQEKELSDPQKRRSQSSRHVGGCRGM